MPEGPEVRTVCDKLRPILLTRAITSSVFGTRVESVGSKNLKYPAVIISVRSYGKKIIIDLNTDQSIIISLGMAGRLQYEKGNHSHVYFDISDIMKVGSLNVITPAFTLYYDDHRYMGRVDVIPYEGMELYFRDQGPDLLQAALKTWIPSNIWIERFNKFRNRQICIALLEQSAVAGIGWYLATDILYLAKIHPERITSSLTLEEWEELRIQAHKTIHLSYSYQGCTIESFISPDGTLGKYPTVVYHKDFDPLGNSVIKKKMKNGRTAHFVEQIQH